MKQTKILMGMPITVEIADENIPENILEKIFSYFNWVDQKFSTYKNTSEISQINEGTIRPENYSPDMKKIFDLAEITKKETAGYFDIVNPQGYYDPSGIVKGWAIYQAAQILEKERVKKFYVDAGGDIEARGQVWKIGIRNPFNRQENVKIIYLKNLGVATSGSSIRGNHIYNPHRKNMKITEIVSLTVIGPNVLEADRFATAVFAMGRDGINFIEKQKGLEGYMIDKNGLATMTSGFEKYTKQC